MEGGEGWLCGPGCGLVSRVPEHQVLPLPQKGAQERYGRRNLCEVQKRDGKRALLDNHSVWGPC